MSAGISLEEMEAAARVCAANQKDIEGDISHPVAVSERIKAIDRLMKLPPKSYDAEITRRRIRELTHAELAIETKFPTDGITTPDVVANFRADLQIKRLKQERRDRLKYAAVVVIMVTASFIAGLTLPELIRAFF